MARCEPGCQTLGVEQWNRKVLSRNSVAMSEPAAKPSREIRRASGDYHLPPGKMQPLVSDRELTGAAAGLRLRAHYTDYAICFAWTNQATLARS